ncbi:MAG: sigma-70 family RNA polymerase sigma factor [Cyanobacteria bacterium SZAS TMP-1]|nr:sigma-70 family RNA polymerase sigma factor [Cyanobacteria bacterium SZAS TMP-1]
MAERHGENAKIVEEWVRTYSKGLFSYAATRMNSAADAEDVVQETFLKAYRSISSFKPGTDAKSWLYQILINTIRDHYRKASSRTATMAIEDVDETEIEMSALVAGPEELAQQREQTQMLGEALTKLPEQLAAPLMLREIADQSYKDIAGTLEIPIGTVMSRLSRARKLLAKVLAPQLGRDPEIYITADDKATESKTDSDRKLRS